MFDIILITLKIKTNHLKYIVSVFECKYFENILLDKKFYF